MKAASHFGYYGSGEVDGRGVGGGEGASKHDAAARYLGITALCLQR